MAGEVSGERGREGATVVMGGVKRAAGLVEVGEGGTEAAAREGVSAGSPMSPLRWAGGMPRWLLSVRL